MEVFHLAFARTPEGPTMLVAAANVAGHRSKGKVQEDPIIWRNCGQVVMPRGQQEASESAIQAARRAFLEVSGIDLESPAVRTAMGCIGDPEVRRLQDLDGKRFLCVYQEIAGSSPLVQAVNKNISAGRVADDELHDASQVAASGAIEIFGVRPFNEGWRLDQFEVLVPPWSGAALEHMFDPFDWFVIAAGKIPG